MKSVVDLSMYRNCLSHGGHRVFDCCCFLLKKGMMRGMLFGLLLCKHCFINIYNANKENEDEDEERKSEKKKRKKN